jgi:hypothetical protein
MINWLKDFIKNIIILVCLLGQLILIYQIVIKILNNMELGMLILYYLACELGLHIVGEPSVSKRIISLYSKKY